MTKVLALAGGVGGGRMADGFYRALGSAQLTVVVNTADDFELHGLRICPDLDSVTYTLSGWADQQQGWGIAGETYEAMSVFTQLGGAGWFRLGDRDLGLHLQRTEWLRQGLTLQEVTDRITAALKIQARLIPMCEAPVATVIVTREGELAFQEYFVKRQQKDEVIGVRFEGIERSTPAGALDACLEAAQLVVLCPSNPFVSLQPILAVPGLRALVERGAVPRVGVSPIIGGQAIKGPAARMLASMGHECSALGVARLYQGLLSHFVIDEQDSALCGAIEALGMRVLVCPTWMRELNDRESLARRILEFCLGES